jgi:hypothetical protein
LQCSASGRLALFPLGHIRDAFEELVMTPAHDSLKMRLYSFELLSLLRALLLSERKRQTKQEDCEDLHR